MLTDQELDQAAQAHVDGQPRSPGPEPVAVLRCELADPPGRYYTVEAKGATDKHGLASEGFVGSVGFFIDRRSGDISHFDPSHLMAVTQKLKETRGTIDWERDLPLIVKYMYIHAQGS